MQTEGLLLQSYSHCTLKSHVLHLTDWEPQVDISRACKGPRWPRSWNHRPIPWYVRLCLSPPTKGEPALILWQSQHTGVSTVSNLGQGCHRCPSQTGFVNIRSLDCCSASKTSSLFQTFLPSIAILKQMVTADAQQTEFLTSLSQNTSLNSKLRLDLEATVFLVLYF